LWIGAHPAAPSRLRSGTPLGEAITADPEATLGPASVAAFGPRLPFLLKVLAVAEPLSLQVHPDRDQAERGFAAERAREGDPARNYKDDWPKPEILCALTDFHALCGWRDPRESAESLAAIPALRPVVDLLRAGDLRGAVEMILTWPSPKDVVAEVLGSPEPYASLAVKYPGDMGVIVAMLLNEVRLLPGQALYVPPRRPHAYLSGTGVELMAGSDNVLRAGLTPKHMDVPELLSVVSFEPGEPDVIEPAEERPGEETYPAPAPEFRLSRLDAARHPVLRAAGPQLLLCAEGDVRVNRDTEAFDLRRGDAVFVEHDGGPIHVEGTGTLFRADLP
ncbi:MAG: mannose-6-phosphate isomerase, class I, partial [Actinoallomurus sp.]